MNIVHVILDYLLIFGIGSFHGLGLTGAAVAIILAGNLWFHSNLYKIPAYPFHRIKIK